MAEINQVLSVLLRFLPPAIFTERVLEFFSLLFESTGALRGKELIIAKFSTLKSSEKGKELGRLAVKKQLILQLIGAAIGIILCWKSNLRIFYLLGYTEGQIAEWVDIVLSGLLISGGSEPIHSLIAFLQHAKEKAKAETARAKEEAKPPEPEIPAEEKRAATIIKVPAIQPLPGRPAGVMSFREPEVSPRLSRWEARLLRIGICRPRREPERPGEELPKVIPIDYRGGIYPDLPGHGLRPYDPQYIVYHHTAGPITASFEEVVESERQPRWTEDGRSYILDPSYHCVITADGTYHNYCRWDSIGWHVKKGPVIGNSNSLGISLVGNFETREQVPGSNYDGHDGPPEPTPEQLETAAQVVALWMLLYDIPLVNIVPHEKVLLGHTACPGNNFPHEDFLQKVWDTYQAWLASDQAQRELREFRRKPYIYV